MIDLSILNQVSSWIWFQLIILHSSLISLTNQDDISDKSNDSFPEKM